METMRHFRVPQLTCISARSPRRLSRWTADVFGSVAGAGRRLSTTRARDRGSRCSERSRRPSTGAWAPGRAAGRRGHGRLGGRAAAAGGSGASAWACGAAAEPSAGGAWSASRRRSRRPSAEASSAGIASGPLRRVEACRRRLGTGVVVAGGEAGSRTGPCRLRGLVGRDSLHWTPFPGTQCRLSVSRPSPWMGKVVSPWRTRRNFAWAHGTIWARSSRLEGGREAETKASRGSCQSGMMSSRG